MKKTELEAVNILLARVNEATISSLNDKTLDSNYDAATALTILRQTTSETQILGVYVNKEKQTLSPDVDGYISLPTNCLNITSTRKDNYRNLVEKGNIEKGVRLYDLDCNTYHFDSSIEVEITFELPFSELPAAVQNYIVMQSAITFTLELRGDKARLPYTESQLQQARAALDKTKLSNSRPNILCDAPDMIGRYNRYRMR